MIIPDLPDTYTYTAIVFLDGARIYVETRARDLAMFLEESRYKRDYGLGDVIALATVTKTPTKFSHWHYISGGGPKDRNAVFCWDTTYQILQSWRVGKLGKLREL